MAPGCCSREYGSTLHTSEKLTLFQNKAAKSYLSGSGNFPVGSENKVQSKGWRMKETTREIQLRLKSKSVNNH